MSAKSILLYYAIENTFREFFKHILQNFLENLEEMCPWYYMHSDICSGLSTRQVNILNYYEKFDIEILFYNIPYYLIVK